MVLRWRSARVAEQGADGSYGTSLAYGTAMDPACDVMLAYKQNGRFLQPDHGFPIRMIIPGHIGARARISPRRLFRRSAQGSSPARLGCDAWRV